MLQLTTSVHRAREWSLGWLLNSLRPPNLPPALCIFPSCLRRQDAALCRSVASPWEGFGYLCLGASPRDPLLYPPKGQSVWGKLPAKRGWAAGGRRASPVEGRNAPAWFAFSLALQCLLVISDIRGTVAATDPRSWDVLMPDALDPNPKWHLLTCSLNTIFLYF